MLLDIIAISRQVPNSQAEKLQNLGIFGVPYIYIPFVYVHAALLTVSSVHLCRFVCAPVCLDPRL